MIFIIDQIIIYKFALFGALMVMAFFEARLYINEHNLKNKKEFYKVAFIANTITGLFLFLPIYWFDLLVIGLYFVRCIFVGKYFVKLNNKKTKKQARNSYIFTIFKNMMVFVAYNIVFMLGTFLFGIILSIILYN